MKKRNFTLVELLAVTALIVILAGLGFAAFSYASNRGKEAASKSLVARIGAGLEAMRTKYGAFPASADYGDITVTVDGSSGLITKIKFGSKEIDDAKQLKTFLAACDGESLKKNLDGSGNVTDAWGGKIKYCAPGKINKGKFDLVAPGADGGFGTAANESSVPTALTGYQTNSEWACDDIANFN